MKAMIARLIFEQVFKWTDVFMVCHLEMRMQNKLTHNLASSANDSSIIPRSNYIFAKADTQAKEIIDFVCSKLQIKYSEPEKRIVRQN